MKVFIALGLAALAPGLVKQFQFLNKKTKKFENFKTLRLLQIPELRLK